MTLKRLVRAIKGAGDSPCDKFNCQLKSKCARELAACSSFREYVRTGEAQDPLLDFTAKLTKDGGPIKRTQPLPSFDIYRSLDEENETGPKERKTTNVPDKSFEQWVSGTLKQVDVAEDWVFPE